MREFPQLELTTVHYFCKGMYVRELQIPEGVLLTGKTHKTEHVCILSKGEVTVWTETGMQRVSAPFTMVSGEGTKRVLLAHSDSVWTNIHVNPDNETDLDKLEDALIASELIGHEDGKWLGIT